MRLFSLLILTLLASHPARADGDRAGEFDYYLLSLSWSPAWCALTGDDRHDPQCDAGRGLTFTVHGLWPQYETGYPSDCFTTSTDPSRADTAAMADIMPDILSPKTRPRIRLPRVWMGEAGKPPPSMDVMFANMLASGVVAAIRPATLAIMPASPEFCRRPPRMLVEAAASPDVAWLSETPRADVAALIIAGVAIF